MEETSQGWPSSKWMAVCRNSGLERVMMDEYVVCIQEFSFRHFSLDIYIEMSLFYPHFNIVAILSFLKQNLECVIPLCINFNGVL